MILIRQLVLQAKSHAALVATGIPEREGWPEAFECRRGYGFVYKWMRPDDFVCGVISLLEDCADDIIQGRTPDPDGSVFKALFKDIQDHRLPQDYLSFTPPRPKPPIVRSLRG